MKPTDARTVFVHIHIPKCGGTSFNEVLWRNFRLHFHMEYGRFNMLRPSAGEVEWALWRNPSLRAIAGHRFHCRLNYRARDHRLIAITFTRDPVEHFTSAYNFMQRGQYPGFENFSITKAAEWIVGKTDLPGLLSPWFAHGQLEHLDSSKDPDYVESLIDAGVLHVFPIERFADSCLLLKRLYPGDFTQPAFRVKNFSPRLEEADSRVVELLHEHRGHDFAFHQRAVSRLDELLAQHMTAAELETARRRQRRRCGFLGSPLGEAGYIAGRIHDQARTYLERRRWIR